MPKSKVDSRQGTRILTRGPNKGKRLRLGLIGRQAAKRTSRWREEYVERYNASYYQKNKEYFRKWHREYYQRVRRECIEAYGNRCSCCGEKEYDFLTMEHINGGGRKELAMTHTVIFKLRRAGYPKGKYTVLCYNCNCAKGHVGICPHKRKQ